MARRKKERIPVSPQGFESNLGGLFASLNLPAEEEGERVDERSAELERSPAQQPTEVTLLSTIGSRRPLRVAISKKGRGGKVVCQLTLTTESAQVERERLAKAAGKALGCRAWIEGELLCLQGDQRARLSAWVKALER